MWAIRFNGVRKLLRWPYEYRPGFYREMWEAAGVVTLLVVWPVMTHAVSVWQSDDALSFGFLVPPVFVAFVWWLVVGRRRASRTS